MKHNNINRWRRHYGVMNPIWNLLTPYGLIGVTKLRRLTNHNVIIHLWSNNVCLFVFSFWVMTLSVYFELMSWKVPLVSFAFLFQHFKIEAQWDDMILVGWFYSFFFCVLLNIVFWKYYKIKNAEWITLKTI